VFLAFVLKSEGACESATGLVHRQSTSPLFPLSHHSDFATATMTKPNDTAIDFSFDTDCSQAPEIVGLDSESPFNHSIDLEAVGAKRGPLILLMGQSSGQR
jgi:hypothetical protein